MLVQDFPCYSRIPNLKVKKGGSGMVTVKSAAVLGIQAVPIDVEVDIRSALPGFEIVGMAGLSVKESRERIRSALTNSGCTYPMHKIIVNLAPADLKKTGTLYDLP